MTKNKGNFFRKTFLLTDVQKAKLKAIQEEFGLKTETGVFDMALNALYKSTFKYGRNPVELPTLQDTEETMINKAKLKVKAQEAIKLEKENLALAPKINLCLNLLGGEIEERDGFKYCRFTQYTPDKDNSMLIPIRQVDPIIAETSLFTPSKKAIFDARPDVKKKFELLANNK